MKMSSAAGEKSIFFRLRQLYDRSHNQEKVTGSGRIIHIDELLAEVKAVQDKECRNKKREQI